MAQLFTIHRVEKDQFSRYVFWSSLMPCWKCSSDDVLFNPFEIDTKTIFEWQQPQLLIQGDLVFFAGRLLCDKKLQYPALQRKALSYPTDPFLEANIHQLPILWRIGLKAMLHLPQSSKANLAYLTFLLHLNQKAVKIYRRHHSLDLREKPKFPQETKALEVIEQYGVGGLLTDQRLHDCDNPIFTAQEYLSELGILNWDSITGDEWQKEITTLVLYMMRVNASVYADHACINGYIAYYGWNTDVCVHKKYNKLRTWQIQDLFGKDTPTEQTIERLFHRFDV